MRWTEARKDIVSGRVAEVLREFGLLWLVFSLLDKLVAGQLTIPWLTVNSGVSIALIATGTYIELRLKTCRTNTSQP